LARELSWQGTARQYGLNWKSVATIVKRAVQYGLKNRPRPPVHVIGIDEVSRRKGQVYLTVVYDLERRVLLWVGDDRTEEAVRPFFTEEMGRRRCNTLQVICMDMWAAYAKLVKQYAPKAQILFDRFHIVKHLNDAVEQVRRSEMRRLSQKEKTPFKRSRWLLLKNPWNLSDDQKERRRRNGPEPSRARLVLARRSEPLTARTVLASTKLSTAARRDHDPAGEL
jgi:transposase